MSKWVQNGTGFHQNRSLIEIGQKGEVRKPSGNWLVNPLVSRAQNRGRKSSKKFPNPTAGAPISSFSSPSSNYILGGLAKKVGPKNGPLLGGPEAPKPFGFIGFRTFGLPKRGSISGPFSIPLFRNQSFSRPAKSTKSMIFDGFLGKS